MSVLFVLSLAELIDHGVLPATLTTIHCPSKTIHTTIAHKNLSSKAHLSLLVGVGV